MENLIDVVKYIEDKDFIKDKHVYYHASFYDRGVYKDILLNGIKSYYARDEECVNYGWNGKYYISLMKEMDESVSAKEKYVWLQFYSSYPMFVINKNIIVFRCKYIRNEYNAFTDFLSDSFLPFRVGTYFDEWHVFNKINPRDIIGIQYALQRMVSLTPLYDETLKTLLDIVSLIHELDIDLPIYDLSSSREINKVKCLDLIKKY